MYFDPQVKESKADFFNFESLQNELRKALEDKSFPLIAIFGWRRTGKTSLIKTVLHSVKRKHIWIDGRNISSQKSFFEQLTFEAQKLRRFFKIRSLSIQGFEVGFEEAKKGLEELNKKKVILVIDEAQLLMKMRLDHFIAFVYDHYPHIKVVLSGSESGMLKSFLGYKKAKAPLYGRAVLELETHRLGREQSRLFLIQGAKQARLVFSEEEIEEATQHLGGIIGWLTKYGWFRLKVGHKEALRRTIQEGRVVVREEFLKFSSHAPKKYESIIKLMSGGISWKTLATKIGTSDRQLYTILKRLEQAGFIEKKEGLYFIVDPLLEE